jgi:hypothetical protein
VAADAVGLNAGGVIDVLAAEDHHGLSGAAPEDGRQTQHTALRVLHMHGPPLRQKAFVLQCDAVHFKDSVAALPDADLRALVREDL